MIQGAGKVNVLFVHHGDQWIRGSERVLIDHVTHLDRARFSPFLWTNCQPLAELMREQNVPVQEDRFSVLFDYRKPRFDLLAFFRLFRKAGDLIRRNHINVVHCNATESGQWMIPAGWCAGVSVVVQLHNESALRSRCVQLSHHSSVIIGVCEEMLRPFREDGMPDARLRIVRNNVDPVRLAGQPAITRASLGLERGQYVFLSVGSLTKRKAFDVLLHGFKSMASAAGDEVLLIVGDGPERMNLQSLARDLGLEQRVRFLGALPHAPAIIRDVGDAVILSSYWEAAPLVLVEAGFFGRPCIATDVGGVGELIHHEVTGLLTPAGDSDALAESMSRLLRDRDLGERLGSQLRKVVNQEMLAPGATRQFEALYESCLESSEKKSGSRDGRIWYPAYAQWIGRGARTIGERIKKRSV